MLKGKHIIVGITGSIAAYKAASLVRLLVKEGAEVKVVMTELAKQFITPLTLATLSKHPVMVEFYNPENGLFGGLGHGICDIDTNSLMPMKNGDIVPVTISGVTKGQKGAAGELRGYFSSNQAIGNLFINSDEGVYGQLDVSPVEQQALPVAMKQEVKEGPAQILTTVADGEPQYYNVTIESIEYKNSSRVKNLVVLVTDEVLLEKTGGIVQGMSGSPIIQNGKIVGAVTHVFLNDPTRGYGIFAENMVENLVSIEQETVQKAS